MSRLTDLITVLFNDRVEYNIAYGRPGALELVLTASLQTADRSPHPTR